MGNKQQKKNRGAYFTPSKIADFIVNNLITGNKNSINKLKILEPSAGRGIFIEKTVKTLLNKGVEKNKLKNNIYAVEIYKSDFLHSLNNFKNYLGLNQKKIDSFIEDNEPDVKNNGLNFYNKDFFRTYKETLSNITFDLIIGNPPYIRYGNFKDEQREIAFEIMREYGLKPTRLTNAWVPFLVLSTTLLSEKGKLGMVLPAELLQVKYCGELRKFLVDNYEYIQLYSFKKLIFPGIQQEVVLFLGNIRSEKKGIEVYELHDANELKTFQRPRDNGIKELNHDKEKWTQYFLTIEEINHLRVLKKDIRLIQFGDIAIVNVGIVTGRNAFFLVDKDTIAQYNLKNYLLKLVGRTKQFKGLVFSKDDWQDNYEKNQPVSLLNLPKKPKEEFPELIQEYIEMGEEKEYHLGFKTRRRKPWYMVPSIWAPDAFLYRQIYDYPRLIYNELGAECTDTIHRVKYEIPNHHKEISLMFHNSITLAFSEITGRSYGGGVLELEPRESLKLLFPNYKMVNFDDVRFEDIHLFLNGLELVDFIDQEILIKQLEFSEETINICRKIWQKMSERRRNRK